MLQEQLYVDCAAVNETEDTTELKMGFLRFTCSHLQNATRIESKFLKLETSTFFKLKLKLKQRGTKVTGNKRYKKVIVI